MAAKKKVKIEGRTEEESQQSMQERTEFLRQREKDKAKLMEQGATKKEAITQATTAYENKKAAEEQERRQFVELQQGQQKAEGLIPELEQQRVFDETRQAQPLQTETTPIESNYITGKLVENIPSVQAIRAAAVLNTINQDRIKEMGWEEFKNNPEVLSEPMLNEIISSELDFEVFKSGEATASRFGSFIEAIPVAGGLARKYAGGLITTPSSQVDDIVSELGTLETQINREKEAMSSSNSLDILNNLRSYEDRVALLESKIKLLTIQSAELKSAPEEVNNINTKIQGIYTNINQVRTRAAGTAVLDVQTNPDKAYLLLKRLKNETSGLDE